MCKEGSILLSMGLITWAYWLIGGSYLILFFEKLNVME